MEPTLRRLGAEFGDEVAIANVMGGLAREFGAPERIVATWLDAAERSGMPVDPRLWLQSPPASSHPACLAVIAAAEQGDAPAGVYLRRLREGFAFRRRKLDGVEALVAEARGIPGLDPERLRIALQSSAILERLGEQIERARAGASALPTLVFHGADGSDRAVGGFAPYEEVAAAARSAGAQGGWPAFGGSPPGIEEALRRMGALASAEVAAVCDLPGPRACAELWQLAMAWRVRPERHLSDWLWTSA
jgi:predicted DsbA family dithiol-disulfide isomerase